LTDDLAGRIAQVAAKELRQLPDAVPRLTDLAWRLRAALVAPNVDERAERVNQLLRTYNVRPYLTNDVGQPYHLHFHGAGETVVEWLGGEYATVLALIIDGYGEDRFGVCEAQKCDAVYIDTTRNGSRRYCSAACTARAKVAAYRERRSPDGP
jgi:predicted RNA-binding Zn ribbon-like protein